MKRYAVAGIVIGIIIVIIAGSYLFIQEDNGSDSILMVSETHVTNIIDGDTIEVGHQRIRLSLTSTPELNEKGGIEAKEFTTNLCPIGSIARVVVDGKQPQDQYGRTIAKVYCGEALLNSELLEYGFATIDKRFCSVTEFANEDWVKEFGC